MIVSFNTSIKILAKQLNLKESDCKNVVLGYINNILDICSGYHSVMVPGVGLFKGVKGKSGKRISNIPHIKQKFYIFNQDIRLSFKRLKTVNKSLSERRQNRSDIASEYSYGNSKKQQDDTAYRSGGSFIVDGNGRRGKRAKISHALLQHDIPTVTPRGKRKKTNES